MELTESVKSQNDTVNKPTDNQDVNRWYEYGSAREIRFLKEHSELGLIRNPDLKHYDKALDFYSPVWKCLVDYKYLETPFFTIERRRKELRVTKSVDLNPRFMATINEDSILYYDSILNGTVAPRGVPKVDYSNGIVILFHINWTQLTFEDMQIKPLTGVWGATLENVKKHMTPGTWAYLQRITDQENKQTSHYVDVRQLTKLV